MFKDTSSCGWRSHTYPPGSKEHAAFANLWSSSLKSLLSCLNWTSPIRPFRKWILSEITL
uniref:Uncharacterized protein n=1 Tax=Arundo donax TaxID=35708 RepID=A0A0A8ZBW9_ARUDO